MPKLTDTVRVTTPDGAVWRACRGCGLLSALPPEVDRCQACRPPCPADVSPVVAAGREAADPPAAASRGEVAR